jgi:hypothetical protein
MIAAWVLILAPVANADEPRPPLKGGVQKEERIPPDRPQSEAICDRYKDKVDPFTGKLQIMPKASAGGPIPHGGPAQMICSPPKPNWTLLGEDRNYCCYFAPHDWAIKPPPEPGKRSPVYPGKAEKDDSGNIPCRGTYTECFGPEREKLRAEIKKHQPPPDYPPPPPLYPGEAKKDQPPPPSQRAEPPPQESPDDSDCLPQVDPQMLERLRRERNQLLREIAIGGYYAFDLSLQTFGKLMAARLHHLTEPNEGIPARTTRAAQQAWKHAPEAVVKAGKAVAAYLTNDVEANHRYLYGQMQMWVKRAEEDLKKMTRNPHLTIAKTADKLLIGGLAGRAVCRQWPRRKAAEFKNETDQALEGGNRLRKIRKTEPPATSCDPPPEDCVWQALGSATGDKSYFLRKKKPTVEEVYAHLKKHFGEDKAKDPLTGRPGDLQSIAEGVPVSLNADELVGVLKRAPEGFKGLIFIDRAGGKTGHVFETARLKGTPFPIFWDTQQRTSNLDIMMAGATEIRYYRTH